MAKSALFSNEQSGGMFSIEDQSRSTGNRWFVHSGTGTDSVGAGRNPNVPLATIDFAIGLATANNGDIIYAMPGHAETLTAAAGIDFDVAGLSLIGLGRGTDRPTITLSTIDSVDIDIAAANTYIENIVFVNDFDAIILAIDVDAAYCTLHRCEFNDDTAAKQTLIWVGADANGDYLTVSECTNHGSDTAGATSWVQLIGCDHAVVKNCSSHGDFSAANIEVKTTAVTDVLITKNHLENANAVDVNIEGVAASTGWISFNSCLIATDAETTWVNTAGAISLYENYGVNNDGETGKLIGTASV